MHILVDSISRDLMTRVQRLSLEDVLNDINVKYPDIPEENYYE